MLYSSVLYGTVQYSTVEYSTRSKGQEVLELPKAKGAKDAREKR